MTCDTVRPQLPLAASGDLAAEQLPEIQRHCDACPACAAELKGLQATLQALTDAGPMATATVDIAAIYQTHAQQQTRSLRRWRRTAFALGAAASLLIGLFAVTRLEWQWDAQQLVLRWGPEEQKPSPEVVAAAAQPVPFKENAETRLARLEELVLALVDDNQGLDTQQQRRERLTADALLQLARQLEDLKQETRRDRAGLYAALNAQPTAHKE
jgi:hypothetical protein